MKLNPEKSPKGGTKSLDIVQVLGSNYPSVQLHPSYSLAMLKAGLLSLTGHRVLIHTGSNHCSSNNKQNGISQRTTAENKQSLPNFISYLIIYSITNCLLQTNRNQRILNIVDIFSKDVFSYIFGFTFLEFFFKE